MKGRAINWQAVSAQLLKLADRNATSPLGDKTAAAVLYAIADALDEGLREP